MTTIQSTLVAPAPDCPALGAEPPPAKAQPTRATIEFDLLTEEPYTLDHMSLSHAVHVAMARAAGKPIQSFEAFHAKGQPCLRASPLTKRYGWGVHYDDAGRIALIDPASAEFAALRLDDTIKKTTAMRSKRA